MTRKRLLMTLMLILGTIPIATRADVRLPNIISSGMVLQRGVKAPVWGKAAAGEQVTVTFAGQTKHATAGKDGRWQVHLEPLEATNEGRELRIKGNNEIRLSDVVVGEVWLASGQSNMEFNIGQVAPEAKKIAFAAKDNKLLRMFCVAERIASPTKCFFRGDRSAGEWSQAGEFLPKAEKGEIPPYYSHSAIGFFFGLRLAQELQIPIGVIDSSWGGTTINCWIPDEEMKEAGIRFSPATEAQKKRMSAYQKRIVDSVEAWLKAAKDGVQHGEYVPFTAADIRAPLRAVNGVYNGMIYPLVPYAFKGVIWYQGETGAGATKTYDKSLKGLISGWRTVFKNPEMQFYVVMIAPWPGYKKRGATVMPDLVWAKQMQVADEIKGCEVIAIHDTTDERNFASIHPPGKMPVGNKLAANALRHAYGKAVPAAGPKFKSATLDGEKVIITFSGIDKGLSARDNKALTWFELSSDNKTFVKAKAVIDGNTVIATADGIAAPKFVRMGWANTATPNLQDKNGWPAFPFSAQEIR